jgi:protein involved in polysaccharide export with SLBB domain
MQLFNGLGSSQQTQLLQQLGLGGFGGLPGSSTLPGGNSVPGANSAANSSQAALLQQQQLQQQRLRAGQQESLFPRLMPGDTVLIDISVPTLALAALQSAAPPATPAIPTPTPTLTPNSATGLSASTGLSTAQLAQLAAQSGVLSQAAQAAPSTTQPVAELAADEKQRLRDLVDLIRAHNPYQLDSNGQLLLPGIPPIALAGLTEDLATRRVAAEPAFEHLQLRLTRLPLEKSGEEALKPFGYDLFDNSLLSFQPTLAIPVPGDYVVGPGDVLQVQLYGSQNQYFNLVVTRDGGLNFPQLGPMHVGGRSYAEIKNDIEGRVARQMIGVHANLSIEQTRAISIFVLGAAKYPGSYALSGLATVTAALFAAGGVEATGSLRTIQVKRGGTIVRALDLYDLLMRGDSANDIKLQTGDVVFIPPVGPTVSLYGQVLRPAIYELKGTETIADLMRMGGGLTPAGDRDTAALVRVDQQQRRVVMEINPTAPSASLLPLQNGDALQVLRDLPQLSSGVTLQGYVYRPRYFAWHEGLRLSDVIRSVDELKLDADQHYLLVRRELPTSRRIEVFSADLGDALAAPGSPKDIPLQPRDTVTVFDLQNSRQYVIQPLMKELQLQSNLSQPTEIAHIQGQVKVPGDYPLEPDMRISDLIRAGGGLSPSAYSGRAELSRYTIVDGSQRRIQVLPIDLNAVRSGNQTQNLVLQPFDVLSVKEVSGWSELATVTLSGEVRFPGTYAIKRGETLRSVMERAGGLTELAFSRGAVFTRVELKQEEQDQLNRLAERMRTSIAELALMGTRAGISGSENAVVVGQTLLSQLQSAKAVGRLVINLDAAINARPGSSNDVMLRDGDELAIPKLRQDVMVLGEVQDSTSHLYHPGLTRDDYIDQSGGMTRQADASQIYIVHADGSVVTGNRGWFRAGSGVQIRAGDAIVVPLNTEKLPALTLWSQSTAILYNLAIAAAAVHAL